MVVFYTLPPREVPYPYVLINANNPENGIQYIISHWRQVKSVIIDSGVEIFRNPSVKDYPGGARSWIYRLVQIYRRLLKLVPGAEVYVTCPDYVDDYNPGALWINDRITNIERTVENVKICVSQYPDVNWLIPVQGHYRRPESLITSIDYYWNMGILDRYKYLAVANLCVERDVGILHRSVLTVRVRLKELGVLDGTRIHIFGLKINALRRVRYDINSFDSTAWTRPVDSAVRTIRNASAKTQRERVIFFCEYIRRLREAYGVEIPDESLDRCRKLGALVG